MAERQDGGATDEATERAGVRLARDVDERAGSRVVVEGPDDAVRTKEDQDLDVARRTRVSLRPFGSPLPLGFLALAIASLAYSASQLGWVIGDQRDVLAVGVLVSAVPLSFLAAPFGFMERDPIAGTGNAVLGATAALLAATELRLEVGDDRAGVGVLLLAASLALVVPAASSRHKLLAAGVVALAVVRGLVAGVAEVLDADVVRTAAGVVGLVLVAAALYAALAYELESAEQREVLPTLRRGPGRLPFEGAPADQLSGVMSEAGVRKEL